MTPPPTDSAKSPPAHATASKADQIADVATTSLEVAAKILVVLSDVTENVPYLNAITGSIQKLLEIRKVMKNNKERASGLLDNIGEVSRVVAEGLQNLEGESRRTAVTRLKDDLKRYQSILEEWTTKSFLKRVWSHGDFPDLADGIDRRLNAFREAFSASRLIALSSGQDAMNTKIQIILDDATRRKLNEWLQPAKVAVSQRDAANKRHPSTGVWLFERPELREWIYAPSSFLWLHGISGCGKTVLSSTVIDDLRRRAELYVYFYFDTNNVTQQTLTQLLHSLAMQLSVRSHFPDKRLNDLWDSHTRGQELPSNSVLIAEALIPLLTDCDQKPIYILLDALDECSERIELLEFLTTMLDARLPNVHILVTSRPEVQIGRADLVARAVSVSLRGCVDGDIELYLNEVLSKERGWLYDKRDEIKRGLLERGNGMFRLVYLQLKELRNCNGKRSEIKKALAKMPDSLHSIYHRILENIRNAEMLSTIALAMHWLIFSRSPITPAQVIDALAFNFEIEPLRFDADERMDCEAFLAACAGFVVLSEDTDIRGCATTTVKLAHASVKEYFLSPYAFAGLPANYEISEQAAHRLIARSCIGYLCTPDVLKNTPDPRQYPLALYAVDNWAFHLTHCDAIGVDRCGCADEQHNETPLQEVVLPQSANDKNNPRLILKEVRTLLQPDSTQYLTLCRLYHFDYERLRNEGEQRMALVLPPLYVCATFGIGQVVRELLEEGTNPNKQSGLHCNALQVASCRGYTNIARLLLEHGAHVNTRGGPYGNALQAASKFGHVKIAQLLLENGANVNAWGGSYGRPLQAAAYAGHFEIARLLLERGADANTQSGSYNNALQAASRGGYLNIARLLLERGADVKAQGGPYTTALQAASYHGHLELARLLLKCGADVNAPRGYHGSALEVASRNGHAEIAGLLLEHGACRE
ncbi:hypothetical protein B0H13DRAFT_905151 [Mycena leptocephala]|nr:hypothetical protein B0H13DRAFT_905151 [Mycena leptocephala]